MIGAVRSAPASWVAQKEVKILDVISRREIVKTERSCKRAEKAARRTSRVWKNVTGCSN